MKTAVISVTEKGRRLSLAISEKLTESDTERFCFHKHCDSKSTSFVKISEIAKTAFQQYDVLIFVCACAIAVRSIAQCVVSKVNDPAVIVVDDTGKYVIPILSGHLGGGNLLAKKLATAIGALAVITTATDNSGKLSPDCFAKANELIIKDMQAAKEIACELLENKPVGLVCDYEYVNKPPELLLDKKCHAGIYIGTENAQPFDVTLQLVPNDLTMGIGCKKGTNCQEIHAAVSSILAENNISFERVCAVTSIDLKAHEQGLNEYCEKHSLPFFTYSAEELKAVEGDFSASEFVKSVTGVDNVCERSAVLHSGGQLVIKKHSFNGVTVAVAEKPVIIDFEREGM